MVAVWRCAFLAFAAVACSGEASIPTALHGRWVCADARYSGRSLLITPHSLIFASDRLASENYSVRSVDSRAEDDGSLVATISYANDAAELTLRVRRFDTDPPSLAIGDRPERWTLVPLNGSVP